MRNSQLQYVSEVPNPLKPKDDEYLDLYLLRLANHNYISGLPDLMASVPDYTALRSPASFIPELAIITGLSEKAIRQMCSKRGRVTSPIDEKYLRMRVSPFCPKCLDEDGYCRLMWQHTYSTCCTKHEVRLVDTCNYCLSQIKTSRPSLLHCMCGQDLAGLKTTKVSKAELWFNKRLSGDLSEVEGQNDFGNTEIEQWEDIADLAEFFAGNLDRSVGQTTGNLKKPMTLEESVERLSLVLSYFSDFPNRISLEIKERLKEADNKHQTAEARLGYWVKRLLRICNEYQFRGFAQGVRDCVTEHADGQYFITESVANVANSKYYNLAQAARALGTTAEQLHSVAKKGHVDMVKIHHSTLSGSTLFLKTYIDEMASTRAGAITKTEAMSKTGLSKKLVDYFLEYKHWEPESSYALIFSQRRLVSRQKIDDLYKVLKANTSPTEAPSVKLADFSLRRTTSQENHRRLFKALTDGALKPTNIEIPQLLAEFAFDKSEVDAILLGTDGERHLKVAEVAELLGVKDEVVRYWIDAKFIHGIEGVQRGQKVRLVSLSSLINFQQKFIPVSVLAKLADTSAKAILEKYSDRGIELPGSYEIGGGVRRGYLIPIKLLAS